MNGCLHWVIPWWLNGGTSLFRNQLLLDKSSGFEHELQVFALTVQLWEDVFGDHSCPDHIRPGEATGCCEHSDVIHKLLMEAPPLITEVWPWEVTAESLQTSLSLTHSDSDTSTSVCVEFKSYQTSCQRDSDSLLLQMTLLYNSKTWQRVLNPANQQQ